jgi:opacity protein-like surface antigen
MTNRLACCTILSLVITVPVGAQTTSPRPSTANAAADFPEDSSPQNGERAGFVAGSIGINSTSDTTAPFGDVEAGFGITKYVSAFGAYGFFRDLRPSNYQPYVYVAIARIGQRGINVTGEAREPAQYAWGGVRFAIPTAFHVSPYAMAGAGWAKSTPSAQFSYAAGSTTISGATASAGQDATADVLSTGVFVGDGWNAAMFRWAAGLSVPIRRSWAVDARYNWSRIFAPTAVTAQGLSIGMAFRF